MMTNFRTISLMLYGKSLALCAEGILGGLIREDLWSCTIFTLYVMASVSPSLVPG